MARLIIRSGVRDPVASTVNSKCSGLCLIATKSGAPRTVDLICCRGFFTISVTSRSNFATTYAVEAVVAGCVVDNCHFNIEYFCRTRIKDYFFLLRVKFLELHRIHSDVHFKRVCCRTYGHPRKTDLVCEVCVCVCVCEAKKVCGTKLDLREQCPFLR